MILENLMNRALRKVRKVSRIVLWHTVLKAKRTVTVRTKQGVFTVLTADDFVGKSLFCFEHHEKDWMESVVKFLRSIGKCPPEGQGTMMDIGANNGCISVGMLLLNKLDKSIAIEPDPSNFYLLERNVEQNGLTGKIFCLPYAVSSEIGVMELELSEVNSGDHRIRMSVGADVPENHHESRRKILGVKALPVDVILADLPEDLVRDISLIWIDVQGHEGFAFEGAKKLLERDIPVVSEFWPYGIRRAGMSENEFIDIAKKFWSKYWLVRDEGGIEKFIQYPIDSLSDLFKEIGYADSEKGNSVGNIIFMK